MFNRYFANYHLTPSTLKQMDALWQLFFAEKEQILRLIDLALEIDILIIGQT